MVYHEGDNPSVLFKQTAFVSSLNNDPLLSSSLLMALVYERSIIAIESFKERVLLTG